MTNESGTSDMSDENHRTTIRLPAEVARALRRACADRHSRRSPWTQQGILTEAVESWLERHGYLAEPVAGDACGLAAPTKPVEATSETCGRA